MTAPVDWKSMRSLTPQIAIIGIAVFLVMAFTGDVKSEMVAMHAEARQHAAAVEAANQRRDLNDTETLRLLNMIVDINRAACLNAAHGNETQVRGCLYPTHMER